MNVETCKSIILLAGRDDSQTFSGKNEKHSLSVGGKTIIHHIIESIEKSDIETICIVGKEKSVFRSINPPFSNLLKIYVSEAITETWQQLYCKIIFVTTKVYVL